MRHHIATAKPTPDPHKRKERLNDIWKRLSVNAQRSGIATPDSLINEFKGNFLKWMLFHQPIAKCKTARVPCQCCELIAKRNDASPMKDMIQKIRLERQALHGMMRGQDGSYVLQKQDSVVS